ncbi:MAG: hypothetical protein WCT52_00120 [Candidatus Micrarchaeia archaeon]
MAVTKTKIAVALFLLLTMVSVAHSGIFTDIGTLFGNSKTLECTVTESPLVWIVLAWISLVLGVFLNAIVTMLGGVLGGQKYNQFLKGGLWGIVETAAILAIFSGAFAGLQEYGTANLDTARAYSTVIRNTVIFDFTLMMAGSTALSFISRQAPNVRISAFKAFPLGFQFAPMFRPLFDGLGTMVQMLAAAIAEWVAHEFVLCFIKTSMLSLLLPIGIFLRAFGFKGAGNALMGLAIALYFIYPFLMIQVGEMLNNYFARTNEPWDPLESWPSCAGAAPICCTTTSGSVIPANTSALFIKNGPNWESDLNQRLDAIEVGRGDIFLSIDKRVPVVGTGTFCTYNTGISRSYGSLLDGLGVLGFWTLPIGAGLVGLANLAILKWVNLSWVAFSLAPLMIAFLLNSAYDIVFFVFIVSIVLPLMMVFITITMAKEIAKVLGTEIDLSALEKLI